MTIRFHPAARAEVQEALLWYRERSPLSSTAFASELDWAVQRIAEAPLRYPVAMHGTRRFLLRRFPYSVYYKAGVEETVIVAVAHHKRRPAYWRNR